VVVSSVVAAAMASNGAGMSTSARQHFDAVGISLEGVNAAVLAIGVFGVLCITREYSTGMIRATFMAHPSRIGVLIAKLATHAGVAGVAAAAACLASFAVGQAVLSTGGVSVSWGDPQLPTALILVCVWGVALGAMLRSAASAMTWLASILVVAPVIVQILPRHVTEIVGRWLPSQIGQQAITSHPSVHLFSAWTGLAVLGGYVGVTLLVGAVRMTRSDP
jgi:hypothetical protein